MIRSVLAVALTITAVAFSLSNTHHVPLSFVLGEAVQIRMIFLLLSAFIAGVVTTLLYQQIET